MQRDELLQDSERVQKITPYRKLRLLRGWSLEEASERFNISRRSLIDIELDRKDAPKWLVRTMDKVYGCNGELIDYWLPRFSVAPIKEESPWMQILFLAIRRCMTSAITAKLKTLMKIWARMRKYISRPGKWSGEK